MNRNKFLELYPKLRVPKLGDIVVMKYSTANYYNVGDKGQIVEIGPDLWYRTNLVWYRINFNNFGNCKIYYSGIYSAFWYQFKVVEPSNG